MGKELSLIFDAGARAPLKIPLPSAEESEWVATANGVAKLLADDVSIAFATADFVDANRANTIEEDAVAHMTQLQLRAYTEWKAGSFALAKWDFPKHTKPIARIGKGMGDWAAKTAALQRIYGDESITPEQTKAWILGNFDMHALVKAVVLLVRAERAACGGLDNIDPKMFAEKVAVKKLLRRLKCHTYKKTYESGKDTDVFKTVEDGLAERLVKLEAAVAV